MARKMGAPSRYKPEYCQLLISHMSQGLSFESFGATVGVHREIAHKWAKVHAEFSEAKKTGTDNALVFWEKLGVGIAAGRIKGNAAIWIFTVCNRFKDLYSNRHQETMIPLQPIVIRRVTGQGEEIALIAEPKKETVTDV